MGGQDVAAATSPTLRSSVGDRYYLSSILNDHSRYVVAWSLCTNMRAEDVTDALEPALKASRCGRVTVPRKPRLLSDDGSSYVSGGLGKWFHSNGMDHIRGAPNHPKTQGKVER